MSVTYRFYVQLPCIACLEPNENGLRESCDYEVSFIQDSGLRYAVEFKVASDSDDQEGRRIELRQLLTDFGLSYEEEWPKIPEQSVSDPLSIKPKKISKWNSFKVFIFSHWFTGGVGVIAGFALLILSFVGGIPFTAMIAIGVGSSLLTLILGAYSFRQAYIQLSKMRILAMDALFVISAVTVLVVSIASFFVPWLPMLFETGLLIFGFRHLGLAIKESLADKMMATKTFQSRLPKTVRVYKNDICFTQDLEQIKANDVLVINPGELIPVDGECFSEECYIHEELKTGNPIARLAKLGEKLLSGMRLANYSKPMYLRTSLPANQSYLARFDTLLQQHHTKKAPIEETASKILHYFIPTVLAIAVLSGVIIGLFFPPALAIQCAVAVLVSACPCILGMVIPMAVKIGMQKGAEHGVQFKDAANLQMAAEVNVVVFDLHGTLTTGQPIVKEFINLDCQQDLLSVAALMEKDSKHVMGKSIYQFATNKRDLSGRIAKVTLDNSYHAGVKATIDEQHFVLGNEDIMRKEGIDINKINGQIDLEAGELVIYLAREKQVCGYFILSDELRPEAKACIETLSKQGIKSHLCTGADLNTAKRFAKLLGIAEENIRAGYVGIAEQEHEQAKTSYIQSLRQQGLKVAMVGDGGNDAPALQECDFGIAVQSDSADEMTQQQAGAIIKNGSLFPVANTFVIAQQTLANIKQNLFFSLSYNMAAVLLASTLLVAAGFVLNPGIGAALMILQMGFVFANAYRFKQQALPHLNQVDNCVNDNDSYKQLTSVFKPGVKKQVRVAHQPEDTYTPTAIKLRANAGSDPDCKQPGYNHACIRQSPTLN